MRLIPELMLKRTPGDIPASGHIDESGTHITCGLTGAKLFVPRGVKLSQTSIPKVVELLT